MIREISFKFDNSKLNGFFVGPQAKFLADYFLKSSVIFIRSGLGVLLECLLMFMMLITTFSLFCYFFYDPFFRTHSSYGCQRDLFKNIN